MLTENLAQVGIRLSSYGLGNYKIKCPQCSYDRKNKADPCLSVTIDHDGAVWKCHNLCGFDGAVTDKPPREATSYSPRPTVARTRVPDLSPASSGFKIPVLTALPQAALDYLRGRGIDRAALDRAGVMWGEAYFPQLERKHAAIAFLYRDAGAVANVKYRTLDKEFTQTPGGARWFYLQELLDTEHGDAVVIVEGELDALSLLHVGIENAISVPNGAQGSAKEGKVNPEEDKAFSYLWDAREILSKFSKIVIAVDGDERGRALAEELSRRIGRERCWTVQWPEGCKDANDVLKHHGAAALTAVIDGAKPWPIKSLYSADAYWQDVMALWEGSRKPAWSTGWPSLDDHYRIRQGELTVVTGIPGSGKSELIDALVMNLSRKHGWRFGVCSFENSPDEHIAKLMEKYAGKPFHPGPTQRLVPEEMKPVMGWLAARFFFIRAEDDSPTIDWILEKAGAAVAQYGINGLVIDPYNEIEHHRPTNMSETEYVSAMLAKVKRFAEARGVHVWFVAHPTKMLPEKGNAPIPVPTLYHISGSANWVNKADVGIVIAREMDSDLVAVHVKKVRHKASGKPGVVSLRYDRVTGRYSDPSTPLTPSLPGMMRATNE